MCMCMLASWSVCLLPCVFPADNLAHGVIVTWRWCCVVVLSSPPTAARATHIRPKKTLHYPQTHQASAQWGASRVSSRTCAVRADPRESIVGGRVVLGEGIRRGEGRTSKKKWFGGRRKERWCLGLVWSYLRKGRSRKKRVGFLEVGSCLSRVWSACLGQMPHCNATHCLPQKLRCRCHPTWTGFPSVP